MSRETLKAIISSTARDLPEHRAAVNEACQRMGVFPLDMKNLPARDADAIRVSLELVDQADIYIGVFAHRYGHIPEGHDISITEMEFNRAIERKIPILIFLIANEHPITIDMVEKGDAARKKLEALKERASASRIRRTFKSIDELRAEVIHSLAAFEKERPNKPEIPNFHPLNIIPQPPEPYIAHPYSLLQTSKVIGRQTELNLLTDWITANKAIPADVRLFHLIAIGGMGKSALTWKWFNDIAPNEKKFDGRMWWSFYESDAYFENFIIRALAYVSGQPEETIRKLNPLDRENQLFHILDTKPFLLVLDGLERILIAYARMDAAQMLDDENFDNETKNHLPAKRLAPGSAPVSGAPDDVPSSGSFDQPQTADSFIGKHQLRRTSDHRAGQFLRRLARVRESRILISTRLYPTELQTDTADPLPGCHAEFLRGLTDADALNLWREFKITGSTEQLQPIFRSFDNYPLLIRALAGEVANFRSAPRDFDKWRAANPNFNPTKFPLTNAKTHVLQYALQSLTTGQQKVLHTIAAFRMPATWETLRALLVRSSRGDEALIISAPNSTSNQATKVGPAVPSGPPSAPLTDSNPSPANVPNAANTSPSPGGEGEQPLPGHLSKPCPTERELDQILTDLEDRGLVGWDRTSNRYDLHPIVRVVAWNTLNALTKQGILHELRKYFEAIPKPPDWRLVESLNYLAPAIQLFHCLVDLRQLENAARVFGEHLGQAGHFRLGISQLICELLERLFDPVTYEPIGPMMSRSYAYVLNSLAIAYSQCGNIRLSIQIHRKALEVYIRDHFRVGQAVVLSNLCDSFRLAGNLRDAELAGRSAIQIHVDKGDKVGQSISLLWFALFAEFKNQQRESYLLLQRSLRIRTAQENIQSEGFLLTYLCEFFLRRCDFKRASELSRKAAELAQYFKIESDIIRTSRLVGTVAMFNGDFELGLKALTEALNRARRINLAGEELPTLLSLAELSRRSNQVNLARDLLAQLIEPVERGPYPLFHADALHVLAQIEIDEQRPNWREAAVAAATKAYTLAWCDGISADGKTCYAYHYGLTNAKKLLTKLGAPEPKLPPFDESKFEPLPDVELNPKDEFWVDPATLDLPTEA